MAKRRNRRDAADPAEAQLARELHSNFEAALPCQLFFASHSSKHVVGPGLVVSVSSDKNPNEHQVAVFQDLPRNNFSPRKKLAALEKGHLNNLPLVIISGGDGFGAAADADDPWHTRLPTADEIHPRRYKLFGTMKPESVLENPCDEGNWEFSFESPGTEVVILAPFWRATPPIPLQLKTGGSRRSIATDLAMSVVNTYSNGDGRTMLMTVDPLCPCKEIALPSIPSTRFDGFHRFGLFSKAEEDEKNAEG